jgi:antitoxin CptB
MIENSDPNETSEARLKRMSMRSWRRGTKEMDLILGPFSDTQLANLTENELIVYDMILRQNDQDLLPWVLGQSPAPTDKAGLLARIATHARARLISTR